MAASYLRAAASAALMAAAALPALSRGLFFRQVQLNGLNGVRPDIQSKQLTFGEKPHVFLPSRQNFKTFAVKLVDVDPGEGPVPNPLFFAGDKEGQNDHGGGSRVDFDSNHLRIGLVILKIYEGGAHLVPHGGNHFIEIDLVGGAFAEEEGMLQTLGRFHRNFQRMQGDFPGPYLDLFGHRVIFLTHGQGIGNFIPGKGLILSERAEVFGQETQHKPVISI